MAIKRTTWHFDNCPCIMSFTRDTESDYSVRLEAWESTQRVCPEHQHLEGEELFQFVREENNRAAVAQAISKDVNPTVLGHALKYKYSADRVLEVQFDRIVVTTKERARIQAICDIKIGPNKVRVLDFVVG